MRSGRNGRPASWIHPTGGRRWLPYQALRMWRSWPRRFMHPLKCQQSDVRPWEARCLWCPLHQSVLTGICFCQMTYPTRMSDWNYWLTLAYAQALQYWVKEASPLAPSEPCLLVMSIHELRWHMGKHTTFHNCNVFKGLVNASPRATVKDTQPSPMGSSPVEDLTTSSSTSKAEFQEDTQPSPMGDSLTDNTTASSSTSKAEVEDDAQPGPTGCHQWTPPSQLPCWK